MTNVTNDGFFGADFQTQAPFYGAWVRAGKSGVFFSLNTFDHRREHHMGEGGRQVILFGDCMSHEWHGARSSESCHFWEQGHSLGRWRPQGSETGPALTHKTECALCWNLGHKDRILGACRGWSSSLLESPFPSQPQPHPSLLSTGFCVPTGHLPR